MVPRKALEGGDVTMVHLRRAAVGMMIWCRIQTAGRSPVERVKRVVSQWAATSSQHKYEEKKNCRQMSADSGLLQKICICNMYTAYVLWIFLAERMVLIRLLLLTSNCQVV